VTIWANRALISHIAKARPGLISKIVTGVKSDHKRGQGHLPCVSPDSKRQMVVGHGDRLVSAGRRICLALAKLRKAESVECVRVWKGSPVSLSGGGRDGDKCAGGNSDAIGECEWAQRETAHGHWEEAEGGSASRIWDVRKGIQRTGSDAIKPLRLPDEAVYLVHLVCSSFRPALFTDHCVDLFAEGSDVFRIVKKTVQDLHDRLWRG
jgi:hypothetical protein